MHRRWSRLVVAVAALALLTSTASAQETGSLRDQLEDREEQREDAEQRLSETRAEEGQARDRLAEADRQLEAVLAELARVEQALADATEARDAAAAEVDRLRAELQAVEAELAETEAELAAVQDRFESRVAGAYKRGASATETAFFSQLLAADDISEALSTAPFLTAVMDADRRLVDDVQDLLADVHRQRGEVAQLRVGAEREARTAAEHAAAVEERAAEQEALSEEVAARRSEHEAALEALQQDRQAIESHLSGLEAESARISDQLAAIAREQAAEAERRAAEEEAAQEEDDSDESPGSSGGASPSPSDPPPSVGGWTRPVGGGVSSPFGPRWGRNHNGVDLAGSVGTSVAAARSGTVVSVTSACHPTSSFGCGGGFGNHVVISHDGGLGTVYAHLSNVSVGAGQSVSAGQRVGAVGNSGSSYGAHLHFEVHDGGRARNPCGYIAC